MTRKIKYPAHLTYNPEKTRSMTDEQLEKLVTYLKPGVGKGDEKIETIYADAIAEQEKRAKERKPPCT